MAPFLRAIRLIRHSMDRVTSRESRLGCSAIQKAEFLLQEINGLGGDRLSWTCGTAFRVSVVRVYLSQQPSPVII